MNIRAVACVLALAATPVPAQVEISPRKVEPRPSVYVDVQSSASDTAGSTRVDTYVQVPYDEIRFVKDNDTYLARFELSLDVTTPEKEHVWSKDVLVEVRVRDFAQTTSAKMYSLRQITAELPPGTYHMLIQMQDQESKKSFSTLRKVEVHDFERDSLSLSDIMLVNRVSSSGDVTTIVPNVSGIIGEANAGFYLFFEVYNHAPADSLMLTYAIYNAKGDHLFRRQSTQPITGRRSQIFFKVDSLRIPIGMYSVRVEAYRKAHWGHQDQKSAAARSRMFSVRWSDVPFTITDIDKAIDQLRYIARDQEIDFMREAETVQERRERFLEFWNKRDPDPSTVRNELMDEYYSRIEQANNLFSTYFEGWRTDRGMVFIRYGPPDNVDRHPFELNTYPYEVWYYYEQDMMFKFVDQTGFGDYRLVYPTTDLWGRVK